LLRGLIFASRSALFAGQQARCGLCGLCGVTFGLLHVRAREQTVTRNRGPWCRCCGMPAENTHRGPCGADHIRHAAVAQAVILALWGTAGPTRYRTEIRAQRLAARRGRWQRAAGPGRHHPASPESIVSRPGNASGTGALISPSDGKHDQRIMSPAHIALSKPCFTCCNATSWGVGRRRLAAYLPRSSVGSARRGPFVARLRIKRR
jgi:hypothetical protein